MRIDHVIYAAADLDAATGRLAERLGLEPGGGGRHDGIGTHNRIFPLGGGYLEVLAIADPAEASSGIGAALTQRLAEHGDRLMGWAVTVDDVAPEAERLGPVTRIGRQGLTADLAGVDEAMAEPALPFFIARDHGIPDPGLNVDAGGITWLEVAGDAVRLARWLGGAELPVRAVEGTPGVVAVGIGDRELR